jgi:hypothetical protein
MHTRRYDEYIQRHEDDDIYQEEIEVDQDFTISDGTCLTELDTDDVELLDEEAGPSNKHLQKLKRLLKGKKDINDLMHVSRKQIPMLYVIYLLLL